MDEFKALTSISTSLTTRVSFQLGLILHIVALLSVSTTFPVNIAQNIDTI